MTSENLLTILKPFKPSSLPSEEVLVGSGTSLINSSASWTAGRTYHDGRVKTCQRPKGPGDGAPWYCRHSEHMKEEITFNELWTKLSVNKAVNEKNYIHEIKDSIKVKQVSPTAEIWAMHYHFTPPVTDRVFTVFQVVHLSSEEGKPRVGTIVSLPVDLTSPEDQGLHDLEPKGAITGRYVSVERVMELENGNIEWRVVTSSSPGGNIPSFIVNSSMAKTIAHDVPSFLKWYRTLSEK
ncbi:hypothetical protein CPB83DRAFT_665682 [Crepidotus variabilis]|uniref:DUF3074 domain-containing protein n=1 Tax=Crepidotus variabilis TaxID=179855 RepID=A0A9P6ENR9_9AGAR|nr:hypothetical protein CPB83DRAFT_665682 [Crepidotus variabilis]